jgi:hypothetical protein
MVALTTGPAPAPSDEAQTTVDAALGFQGQGTSDNTDSEAPAPRLQGEGDEGKRFATLQAQLALRGFALTELADRSYIVSRWSLVRPLPDLRAVRDFAVQAGAL